MFAVIKTGGKQYRVQPNDVIRVEKLTGEAGDTIAFESVLMVSGDAGVTVGAGHVDGAVGPGDPEHGGAARGEARRPGDDLHLEGESAGDDGAADVAGAQDAQGAALEAEPLGILRLLPGTRPQIRGGVGHPAVRVEQVGEGDLGRGDGVGARAVRHEDAPGRGRRQVDGVHPGPRADDELQRGAGGQGVGGDLGGPHDEDLGGQLGDGGGEGRTGEARVDVDLEPGGLQLQASGVRHGVGDQDAHRGASQVDRGILRDLWPGVPPEAGVFFRQKPSHSTRFS